jgi:hemerythrin-like domain-containing protein
MKILRALTRDHRILRDLLDRLELELDLCVAYENIDAEAVSRLVGFFERQIDGLHQDVEELVLLPRLLRRAPPDVRARVHVLIHAHTQERSCLAAMRTQIEGAAYGDPTSLAAFVRAGRTYVEHQRRHSEWEQVALFPLAERHLTPRDDRAMLAGLRWLERRGPGVQASGMQLLAWLARRSWSAAA